MTGGGRGAVQLAVAGPGATAFRPSYEWQPLPAGVPQPEGTEASRDAAGGAVVRIPPVWVARVHVVGGTRADVEVRLTRDSTLGSLKAAVAAASRVAPGAVTLLFSPPAALTGDSATVEHARMWGCRLSAIVAAAEPSPPPPPMPPQHSAAAAAPLADAGATAPAALQSAALARDGSARDLSPGKVCAPARRLCFHLP